MPKQFLRSPWPKLSVGTHIVRVEGTDPEIGSELKVFNLDAAVHKKTLHLAHGAMVKSLHNQLLLKLSF